MTGKGRSIVRMRKTIGALAAAFLLLMAVCGYLIHISYHKLTVRGYELPVSGLEKQHPPIVRWV